MPTCGLYARLFPPLKLRATASRPALRDWIVGRGYNLEMHSRSGLIHLQAARLIRANLRTKFGRGSILSI
jgi:hypothetical protein